MSWEERKAVPWKNGGGTTRQLAVAPAGAGFGDLDWSVSVADIGGDGPFSDFAGLDRVLLVIDGDELVLDVDGTTHRLGRLGALAFPGEAATACRVPSGPVRALNVMTRRGRASGTMRIVEVVGSHAAKVGHGETVALVALSAGLVLDGDGTLAALDAVIEDTAGQLAVAGSGILVEVRIRLL